MRLSVASDLVLKYGRGRGKYSCNKYCKNLHISLLNATAASRVFVLYRRLRALNKSQRNLHDLLKYKIELAIDLNCDIISLKYYLFRVINENLEKMREYFIKNDEYSNAIEARLGILIDVGVNNKN